MATVVYRLRSTLRRTWPQALAAGLLVSLLGALVLALLAGATRSLSAPDRYEAWWGEGWDVALEQASGLPRTGEVAGLRAVDDVRSATFVFAGVIPEGAGEPIDAFTFAGDGEAVGGRVVDGREARGAREFVATEALIEAAGLRLGDELTVAMIPFDAAARLGFDALGSVEPTVTTATLVGRIAGPVEVNDGFPLALFPVDLLREDVGVSATVSVVDLAPGATAADVRAQLDGLAEGDVFDLRPVEIISGDLRRAVETHARGLVVLAAIVGVAAIAVLGQLLSRQFRLDDDERATLRALGYRGRQLLGDPLSRLGLPVAAGSAVAGVVAVAASGLFPRSFVAPVEPHPGLRLDPVVHLLGALGLALVLLAWTAAVLAIAERRSAPASAAAGSADGLVPALPARAATALRLGLAPVAGPRAGSRASAIGFALVVGGLLGALVVATSMARLVDEPRRQGSSFDFGIGQGGEEVPAEVIDRLKSDEDVTGIALFGTQSVSIGSGSMYVTALEPVRGDLTPMVLDGRLPRTAREAMIGRVTARDLNVGIGDRISVGGAAGEHDFEVTGLGVIPAIAGGDGVGEGGFLTAEGFRRIDPDAVFNEVGLTLADGSRSQVEHLSEDLGVSVGRFDPPGSISNLDRVRDFPLFVAIALAALGALSLVHQMLVGLRGRTRDFAILRSLGAHSGWVSGVVHWQATAVGFLATIIAVPVGVVVAGAVFRPMADRIGAPTDLAVPVLLIAGVVFAVFVVANVAALAPARRVRRRRPAVVLREA